MKKLPLLLLPLTFSACASAPVIPIAPAVKVVQLDSVLITPEAITYHAKVVINNKMRGPLEIEKVDWSAELHDNPVAGESFTGLNRIRARRHQAVTFPFQVPMKNIVDQAVDVLAEEGVRVGLRGAVHSVGFEPVPFEATRTIPIPKIPVVSIAGADGNPLEGAFTVFLKVSNPNDFAMTLESVDSYLSINNKRYNLLRSQSVNQVGPGSSGKIGLTMKRTRGKTLSMALNMIQSKEPSKYEVGGSFSCRTPHGLVQVPLALSSE